VFVFVLRDRSSKHVHAHEHEPENLEHRWPTKGRTLALGWLRNGLAEHVGLIYLSERIQNSHVIVTGGITDERWI